MLYLRLFAHYSAFPCLSLCVHLFHNSRLGLCDSYIHVNKLSRLYIE